MKKVVFFFLFSFVSLYFLFNFFEKNDKLGIVKSSNIVLCKDLNFEKSQIIHPSNFQSFEMDLKIYEKRKWNRHNLSDAIKAQKIGSYTNRKRVKASIIFKVNGNLICESEAEIRSHGDQENHRQGPGLPSLNVNLVDGHIFGIVDFVLLRPKVRKNDNEIYATTVLQEIGLLAPRTSKVILNYGSNSQRFIFQEKIVKEFLENFRYRESAIFEGDERFVFQEGNNNKIRFVNHKLSNENWAKKNLNNKITSEIGLSILNKHGQMHEMKIPKNWIIDYYSLSKKTGYEKYFIKLKVFDSIMFAIDAMGNLSSQDRRFYYDSISQTFVPIFYDGKPTLFDKLNRLDEPQLVSAKNLRIIKKNNNQFYIPNLLNGKVTQAAVDGTQETILLIKKIDIKKLREKLNKRGMKISKEQTKKSIEIILKKLSYMSNFKSERIFNVKALNNSPIEAPKNYLSKINRKILFYGDEDNEYHSCDIYGEICDQIYLSKKKQVKLLGQRLKDENKNDLIFIGKKKTENIVEGWYHYKFENQLRSILTLENDVKLITSGNIEYDLNRDLKKLKIFKKDSNSNVVLKGGILKNWDIEFKDTSLKSKVISNDINGLTGCLTFFRLKVENVKIFSDGSNCEDSINLINVVGSIDYLKIINSSSDGFDADFSDIRVEKIYIENSANDCTDFSFGKYEIKDIYVNGCGDKGISLGETSHLKLDKLVAKNTDIAVASKDYGKLIANDILIKDVKTCLSAYKKKQEFSGGTMILNKMKCQNFSYKMKKDQASKIKFNNNL